MVLKESHECLGAGATISLLTMNTASGRVPRANTKAHTILVNLSWTKYNIPTLSLIQGVGCGVNNTCRIGHQ